MEIIIKSTADEVGDYAASIIAQTISRKPNAVVGVATGSSPLSTYDHLAQRVQQGLDVSDIRVFSLDEYVEIDPNHPQSYHSVIQREITEKIGLNPERVYGLDAQAENLVRECEHYEYLIHKAGGVDVQLLGIGSNGHIAFNEPGSSFASRTRIKTLSPQTRRDNARFFDGDINQVPVHCVTQGIATIMEAKRIVLVALGEEKAEALAAMSEGPIGTFCPASALQMHPNVTVVVDEAAASKLKNYDYHLYAQENLPDWQNPYAD